MAKTTRRTESTTEEKKPATGRPRAAAPVAGAEKVTTRRRTSIAPGAASANEPAGERVVPEPAHDEIALRAWSIYERRGRSHGQAMNDWLQAKSELCRERGLRP